MSDHPTRDTCGCCKGRPKSPAHHNPPGLGAVTYRIGTHPEFLDRMRAGIHRWTVPDGTHAGERPLAALATRDPDDPAIALLDAGAVVLDVLTFYQERIANEGFLRTATERLSVLELARAIGYELRPGVAAEAYVAFAVDEAEGGPTLAEVPAGTQVQSVPAGGDELPQTFETAAPIVAHRAWNALRPRLTAPQPLGPSATHVWVEGTDPGLVPGDRVLLVVGGTPHPKQVFGVTVDRLAGRTRLAFARSLEPQDASPPGGPAGVLDPAQEPLALSRAAVDEHVFQKTWSDPDLQAFLTVHGWDAEAVLAYVADLRAVAFGASDELLAFRTRAAVFGYNAPTWRALPVSVRASYLGLTEATDGTYPIDEYPSDEWPYFVVPAPNGTAHPDWASSSGGGFAVESITSEAVVEDGLKDVAEDLVNVVRMAIEGTSEPAAGELHALGYTPSGSDVDLDAVYKSVLAETWSLLTVPGRAVPFQITAVEEAARGEYLLSGKTTRITLDGDLSAFRDRVRQTTVHAESDPLAVAALPVTDDLRAGQDQLWLGTMALGLAAGQPVALSGVEVEAAGRVRHEVLVLEAVDHVGGLTRLTFKAGPAYTYLRETVVLNANVVGASHGETVAGETLGSGDGSVPHQRFALKKPPLTYVSAATPGGASSTLTVRVDGVAWDEVPSLYGRGPADRVYTVRHDERAGATVQFGDGTVGARPPTGRENVLATYRSGIGLDGEVGADALTLLKTRPYGIRSVTNPLPASGAEDPEALEDARTNAPVTVLTLDRIVSLRDYEDFARAYAGIGKARATAVWTGETEVVHLTVADASGDPVADPLLSTLRAAVDGARDPLRPVVIAPYRPLVFFVEARLLVDDAHVWGDVAAAVEAALLDAFAFERRGFAQPATAAEVVEVAHGVSGVRAVDLDAFYATEAGALPPAGTPLNAVLDARPARVVPATGTLAPADLLLVHPLGITLTPLIP